MSKAIFSESAALQPNAANANGSAMSNASANVETKRKSSNRKPATMWDVVRKARNKFNTQLTKSNEVKLNCLNNYIKAEFPDEEKFWSDFMTEANRLLDSKKFEKECVLLGNINPRTLATHIAFLGSGRIADVLKKGIVATIQMDYLLYTEAFIPETANKYAADYDEKKEQKKLNAAKNQKALPAPKDEKSA